MSIAARTWALTTLAALLTSGNVGAARAGSTPSGCPAIGATALNHATGQVLRPGFPTGGFPSGGIVSCDYSFVERNAGQTSSPDTLSLTVTKGSAKYASKLQNVTENDASTNATQDQNIQQDGRVAACAPPGKPPLSSQCDGLTYDAHPLAIKGLGQRAVGEPGVLSGGAFVDFIWGGNTYELESSFDYRSGPQNMSDPEGPWVARKGFGPDEPQLLAVARLITKSDYKPKL